MDGLAESRRAGRDDGPGELEPFVVTHELEQREPHAAGSAADGETDGSGHAGGLGGGARIVAERQVAGQRAHMP